MSNHFIPPASPIIGQPERDAVDRVLQSGMIAQGPEVAKFEEEFAALMSPGAVAVAVNSGTSALHLGLLAAGIGPGDEVIVPSFTFAATANSVALTGATPVFADIDLDTFNLSPAAVEAAITDKTKAVMPVHLYGLPANMPALREICDKRGLMLFEDSAQAHLAEIDGNKVGTFGTFAAFSLYPTKNMTAGEGGMVTTGDEKVARNVRLLRNQGMEVRYQNELVGFNNRMTDVHAAIGRAQLEQVSGWTEQRQANASRLSAELQGVVVPHVPEGYVHVYHQYTIRFDGASPEERDRMAEALKTEYGVGTGVYYPVPNHRLPSLEHFAPDLHLPVTEKAAAECLSLPVHPVLTDQDLDRIITAVNAVAKAGA
ncbi:DegT/DnrJ/EryC1/StrS family aminotransferase [Corynebacterium aquilae]|uniref:Aminotransferase DegT n=1 Tax=Corynebacterium aquilae DSM 44791 TaxID=1431546 RepID=A0A1L7CIN0_9CORY|nr:DegT/DnrJ/EryC1/StrS family aminotransferase [Corynebacterium aquilae]APT85668.1 aminotransferase DegT [Corynebacterium aquilae DSM 44791]